MLGPSRDTNRPTQTRRKRRRFALTRAAGHFRFRSAASSSSAPAASRRTTRRARAASRRRSPSPSPLTVHLRGEARRDFSPLRATSTLSKHLHTTRVDGVRGRDGPGGASPPILLLYVTFVGRTHVAREWPKHRKSALDFVEHDQMGSEPPRRLHSMWLNPNEHCLVTGIIQYCNCSFVGCGNRQHLRTEKRPQPS